MTFDLALVLLPTLAIGGGIGVYSAAVALGIRHGIDWDHIAAITDITSASASLDDTNESWLIGEPGVMLVDERHHLEHTHPAAVPVAEQSLTEPNQTPGGPTGRVAPEAPGIRQHTRAFQLGTLYALGHGAVVTLLGIAAIVASEFLPSWIDPLMERVVGVTLLFLAAYLFYSVYQYLRGGVEFQIRSRWMLVFAGVANAWHWMRSRIGHHEHRRVEAQQYSGRTAFGIGLIHGIGAETGTQALIIATAVGASSKPVALTALLFFVAGLLISNSVVTFTSTVGFVSARKRQLIYVSAGLFAAIFSLIVGVVFLTQSTGILPALDPYFEWIGGPSTD